MPTERRYIVFNVDELREAANAFNRAGNGSALPGRVLRVAIADGKARAFCQVGETGAPEKEIELDSEFLREALIRFCLENNIPLHRQAKKSVQIGKESLAILMVLGDAGAEWNS